MGLKLAVAVKKAWDQPTALFLPDFPNQNKIIFIGIFSRKFAPAWSFRPDVHRLYPQPGDV